MSPRAEEPRYRGASSKSSVVQEKVAQFYYASGLFCSSYPISVICISISVALLCCYPLINLPLSGNLPMQAWSSEHNGSILWPQDEKPFCYVQQVVLRTAVIPWDNDLTLGDAFRAPLYESFKLLDIVRNYQDPESSKTLGHVCLHVEAIKKSKNAKYNVLPQYSCLVLSPANMWQQDVQQFAQDAAIINTIFNYQNLQKGKTSVAEMLFGMHLVNTGIKRYPIRNRQRILQYAVTLFFKDYDEQFLSGLRKKLQTLYPLHQNLQPNYTKSALLNETVLIHYPDEVNYYDFLPLFVSFVVLFVYYYFSVRKIELIKSKIGMAISATVTVLGSLTTSLGICFFFGLTLSLHRKQIFPYLILLVGLENVLVLTKSVVSTPAHLDVKIRFAQGLSKEGWSITKNLLIELTILTVGLFTFVPMIQEFCIFAIVGLLTDFYLQMFFFSTILGIDTRRMENLVEKTNPNYRNTLYQTHAYYNKLNRGISRSKSHPKLTSFHTDVVASQMQGPQEKKIPKRLRLVNIWARTRFFQRAFMILMVAWIGMILYDSGVIEQYLLDNNIVPEKKSNVETNYSTINLLPLPTTNDSYIINFVTQKPGHTFYKRNETSEVNKLKHSDYAPWLRLSTQHWPSILRMYNLSLSGNYIAVLPNIKLSHVVTPEQAVLLRNLDEKFNDKFEWQALAAALDPIDFGDLEAVSGTASFPQSERPLYPTSPMEIFLTTILCSISVIVLAYAIFVLYRCVCTRNYAEWRASWSAEKNEEGNDVAVLLEAVPVVLESHSQEVECVATDGYSIVSSCLGGQLKVWDSVTGQLLANIDRKCYFGDYMKSPDLAVEFDDNNFSDYESGSPPSRDEFLFPRLQYKINTNFSNLKLEPGTDIASAKYDFNTHYNKLYFNHDMKRRCKQTADWIHIQNGELNCTMNDLNQSEISRYSESVICEERKTESCEKLDSNINSSLDNKFQNVSSNGFIGSPKVFDNSLNSNVKDSTKFSPIWCIDYLDNLIVIGCANGRLEFWEGTTGKFKCIFEDGSGIGITHIRIIGCRVVATRLYGSLDFFHLQSYSQGRPIDWNFTCAYRRTHIRTNSAGSINEKDFMQSKDGEEDFRCLKILTTKAHQQPITCLDSEGGRVLTGSQDHTLKVFRLEDGNHLYTLHGHCGPITCLFIDRISPATSGSGSQDGMLCVWDLLTGACMYSIQAHNGSIVSLTYTASYVISLGSDERLCVWERFQGYLLNTINVMQTYSTQILMLTPHLVVASRSGSLVVYDVRTGDCVRTIVLGHTPFVFVKQLLMLRDAVLCDYGSQLRIVRFPLITHKFD